MSAPMRRRLVLAAFAYFALVFAAGFALGAARELFLRPFLGPDWSRVAEMPLMIAIAWAAAGFVVARFAPVTAWPRPPRDSVPESLAALRARLGEERSAAHVLGLSRDWLTVGLIAFALLLVAEFLAGLIVLKVGLFAFLASLVTPVGLLGLVAQASLIVFPTLQARRQGM